MRDVSQYNANTVRSTRECAFFFFSIVFRRTPFLVYIHPIATVIAISRLLFIWMYCPILASEFTSLGSKEWLVRIFVFIHQIFVRRFRQLLKFLARYARYRKIVYIIFDRRIKTACKYLRDHRWTLLLVYKFTHTPIHIHSVLHKINYQKVAEANFNTMPACVEALY
jgi:hypothetical protein